jgi:superoxide dismutase, Cu-Zn family
MIAPMAPFDDRHLGYADLMVKPVTLAAVLLATPVAVLSACTSNQPSNQPSSSSASSSATPPPGTQRLSIQLKTPDGTPVANATFDFANGYATVTVETVATHILSPGFHGMHVHSVGKCEANSVAPTGGSPGDFNSAGGHFQVSGHTGYPSSGDLTSLEVRSDGAAKLVTTTDSFTAADLQSGEGTALIIHQDSDNFGNIPSRYTENGTPGPDQATLATGDSGKRVACGVISAPTGATATATTTTTATTAVPTTAGTTTGGATTTAPTTEPSQTSTSTVTVTVPGSTTVIPTTSSAGPVPTVTPPLPGG